MKKRFVVSFLVILSLVLAGSTAGANDKTGFVDIREIMLSSAAGKKASDEIKKVYEKNRSLIQESETELKKIKDELEKQRAILTENALREKESAYGEADQRREHLSATDTSWGRRFRASFLLLCS